MGLAEGRRRPSVPAGDRRLLRVTAVRVALQSGGLALAAYLLSAALTTVIVVHDQHNDALAELRDAVHVADVTAPPDGAWLYVLPDGLRGGSGGVALSPGAPAVLPLSGGLAATPEPGMRDLRDAEVAGVDYRVLTVRQPTRVVQAALSLRIQQLEITHLLQALAAGALLSLLGALAVGALAGRRAAAPLVETLGRQRRFVADASHELRTPLTLLSTRAQMLAGRLQRAGGDPRLTAEAAHLVADGLRLADLLDDLLRTAEPPDPDNDRDVDLTRLAADVVDSASAAAEQRDIALELVAQSGPPHRPPVVRGSPAALARAVLALLDNALEHTPPGGRVGVAVSVTTSAALIVVTDNGPGIPEEVRDRLFDRFAHGPQPVGSGRRRFGLGLALVADTVDRMRGTIEVATPAGGGTQFTLRLPLARSRARLLRRA